MAVSKYSKRPEVVDALMYNGANYQEILDFAAGAAVYEDNVLYLVVAKGQVNPPIVEKDYWVLKDFGDKYSIFGSDFLDYYKPGGGP
jgi:hypothetical protein